ncbi:MAG: HAD hydrolase-like protein [Cyanobacteria bacterium J06623_4]
MPERNLGLSRVAEKGVSSPQSVVFCDFDGPIVDVSERYYQTYKKGMQVFEVLYRQETCQPLKMTLLTKPQFWVLKQRRVADIEIATCSGVPADWFAFYMQQVERLVNHPNLLRWDCLQPSVPAALRYFRQANMRLVLVTLRHARQVNAFLRAQGLSHLVDEVYGASTIMAAHENRVEQKRALLEKAIAQQQSQGHLTQNSWMIGDTEADVLAAKAMNLPSAALSCGVRGVEYLSALEPTQIHGELLSAAQSVVELSGLQAA